MALVQPIENGKVVETATSSISDSTQKSASSSSLDKEAFLQLLVAQMKYQDPLEPTSNTEYIAQLATFSQLEELQNVGSSMSQTQAANLVGKPVIMKTVSSSTGETYYTAGYVDAVIMENGKPYLYINDNYYSIDDLDTVLEEEYYQEYLKSQGIVTDKNDTTNKDNTTDKDNTINEDDTTGTDNTTDTDTSNTTK